MPHVVTFADAARTGTFEPRFIVTVWVASGVSKVFSSGLSDFLPDASPVVLSVSNVARTLDPLSRRTSRNEVTVTLVRDLEVNAILGTYGLKNTAIAIDVGDARIDAAEYLDYFGGVIDEIELTETTVSFRCSPNSTLLQRSTYVGSFVNVHPLEAIELVLQGAGFTTDQYDAASLAYDVDADTSHYVIDAGPPGYGENDLQIINPVKSQDLIERLGLLLTGSLIEAENGKLTFVKFDATQPVAATWTEDDIIDFDVSKIYDNLYNSIEITLGNAETYNETRESSKKITYTHGDTSSQSRYGYNTAAANTPVASTLRMDTDFVVGALYPGAGGFGNPAVGTYVAFNVAYTKGHAVCGTRWPGFRQATPQPANSKLDATAGRLMYGQVGAEIVSFDDASISESFWQNIDSFDPSAGPPFYISRREVPTIISLRVAERGALGTTAVSHATELVRSAEGVYDVTIPVAMAQARVERFANGTRTLEVSTSLAQYGVKVGDLVSVVVDSRRFTAFDTLGLDSDTSWEVTAKELDIFGDTPRIRWTLVFASTTSPPGVTDERSVRNMVLRSEAEARSQDFSAGNVAKAAVVAGFDFVATGGAGSREGNVGTGRATAIGRERAMYVEDNREYAASLKTAVSFDVLSGQLVFREFALFVSAFTATSNLQTTEVALWFITTDATDIISSTDLRQYDPLKDNTVAVGTIRRPPSGADLNSGGVIGWDIP